MLEFKEFFPIISFNILYLITIIINQKHMTSTDTFIEKDASINDEIDKLRHSATSAFLKEEM